MYKYSGLTIPEIARAFNISEQQLAQYFRGVTVTIDEYGEEIIPFNDVQIAREHFIHHKDYPLD